MPVPASGLVQATADYSVVAIRHRHAVDLWAVAPPPAQTQTQTGPPSTAPSKSPKLTMGVPRTSRHAEEEVEDGDGGGGGGDDKGAADRCALSLRIETKGSDPEHVHCLALCPRGRAVACSSAAGTRVYATAHGAARGGRVAVTPLELPIAVARSFCQALAFSADGRRLAGYCVDSGSGSSSGSGGTLVLLSVSHDGADADIAADQGKGKGKGSERKRARQSESGEGAR